MSVHGILGEHTQYPTQYAPELLFAIARQQSRQMLAEGVDVSCGMDYWHVYELSWLNAVGLPQVAIARLGVPANSPNIVESKSLKLYFNSLNFQVFSSQQQLVQTICQDVSACVGAKVEVTLFAVDDFAIKHDLSGICLEKQPHHFTLAQPFNLANQPSPALLAMSQADKTHLTDTIIEQNFYSHLLRSNCPVTNQPDWGTIHIHCVSKAIDYHSLLAYILAFRTHNGFHEACVEQIFADLSQVFKPQRLLVQAWYTRRGGIDINPVRASHASLITQPSRLARQ